MNRKIFITMVAVATLSFVSCEKEEIEPIPLETNETENSVLKAGQVSSPNPSNFVNVYYATGEYIHLRQTNFGKCGPTAYVCARRMKNSTYPVASSNATTIYNLYSSGGVTLAELYYYNDGTSKTLFSKPAGNAQWGTKRTELKTFIENSLSAGKPILIPTRYNMSTSSNNAGHYYIIVEIYLTAEGTGSVVGVKDVWSSSSSTQYFSYTDLLDSNWYNTQITSGVGNEIYCAMSFN